MWDHLTSSDLDRAKQEIERRRAETMGRHAEETKILEAKQAQEIQALNAKLAEIGLLDGLIDVFTEEFKPQPAHSEAAGEVAGAAAINEAEESLQQISQKSPNLDVDASEASNLGPLQVHFPTPNFRAFRRTG